MRKLPVVTPRSDVEIHGVYGQSVLELHEQIGRLLLQDTKDLAIAHFFAEPQVNVLRGEISWYTDADGPITPFTALSVSEQVTLWEQLQTTRDRIKAVGEKYAGQGGQTASTRIDTFRSMLSITNLEQNLFSVGGKPVICEWGCTPLGEGARPTDLWTMGAFRDELKPVAEAAAEISPTSIVLISAEPERGESQSEVPKPEEIKSEQLPKVEPALEEAEPIKTEIQYQSDTPVFSPNTPNSPPPNLLGSSLESDITRDGYTGTSAKPQQLPMSEWLNRSGGNWFWDLLKYLVLFCLVMLLTVVFLRGCSESSTIWDSKDALEREESILRAEIRQLRQQLVDRASQCSKPSGESAPAASSASTVIQRVEREGLSAAGDLTIALQWNGTHDLDLYVREPSGQVTGVGVPSNLVSTTGGHIDLDMNFFGTPSSMSREPVEFVKWEASPPAGKYQVAVRLFRATAEEIPASKVIIYHLVVRGRGQTLVDKSGEIPLSADCKNDAMGCKELAINSFEFK